jgi:hypothetical protein
MGINVKRACFFIAFFATIAVTSSHALTFAELDRMAAKGDAEALFVVGYEYITGGLVTKNEQTGFNYIKQSAEKGYVDAMYNLGVLYDRGIGVEKDLKKAFCWYEKAATAGDHRAQYNAGHMYFNGIGTLMDFEKAFYWFQKSAAGGDDLAQHAVGLCYKKGDGVGTKHQFHIGITLLHGFCKTRHAGQPEYLNNSRIASGDTLHGLASRPPFHQVKGLAVFWLVSVVTAALPASMGLVPAQVREYPLHSLECSVQVRSRNQESSGGSDHILFEPIFPGGHPQVFARISFFLQVGMIVSRLSLFPHLPRLARVRMIFAAIREDLSTLAAFFPWFRSVPYLRDAVLMDKKLNVSATSAEVVVHALSLCSEGK